MEELGEGRSGSVRRGGLRKLVDMLTGLVARIQFPGSSRYWEIRYRMRGSSGAGSYGESGRIKAAFINEFVCGHSIGSVIELGCGDGAQLALLDIPEYVGLDVSSSAIKRCKRRFAGDSSKEFYEISSWEAGTADLVLSLDVIFHLVEDNVFAEYMSQLFNAATHFVVIYSTDHESLGPMGSAHVRHRSVSKYCAETFDPWALESRSPPVHGGDDDGTKFLVYARREV